MPNQSPHVTLRRIELTETYNINAAASMLDNARCLFEPSEADIQYRDGRPSWISVKGYRVKSGRRTETGYAIRDGRTPEPHHRNGLAPEWVVELVLTSIGALQGGPRG